MKRLTRKQMAQGIAGFWVLALILFASAVPVLAQDRPLQTSDAEIVALGTMRAQIGFDFLQDVTFPLSGLNGDLTNVSALNIRTGIGKIVEIQVQGMIQEFLSVKHQGVSFVTLDLPAANSTHDIGDFSIWTKILLLSEQGRRSAVAFRFGFQMPNSNQTRGIGVNNINLYSEAIFEKHFGKLTIFGDLGIAILTSPNALYSQNDELMYGAAFRYRVTPRANVVGEVAGMYSPRKITPALIGTESRGQGRLGVEITAGGLIWDFAGIGGLTKNDPRTGFTFGVSKDIQLFNRSTPK